MAWTAAGRGPSLELVRVSARGRRPTGRNGTADLRGERPDQRRERVTASGHVRPGGAGIGGP
eukprot:13948937-Heterocapsa_arctica.AAC.1